MAMGEFKIQILCKEGTLVPMVGVARMKELAPWERRTSLQTFSRFLTFRRLVVLCQRRKRVSGFGGRGLVRVPTHMKRPWRLEKNLENGHPFLEQNHLVNPLYLLSRIFLILPVEVCYLYS